MHKTTGSTLAVLIVTLLAGCSGGDPPQPAVDASEPPPAAEARDETVFDPMVGTIDRAKGVESTSADRMDELNKQLEGAE